MVNVAIIDAIGSLGCSLREESKNKVDYKVILFSCRAENLALVSNEKATNGSATSDNDLDKVLADRGTAFIVLLGDLSKMARETVAGTKCIGVARIVFVSSMGIYGEVAGESKGVVAPIFKPYCKAVDIAEQLRLDYMVLRPGWFDGGQDSTCQVMQKGETFYGHDVSHKTIVTLVKHIIN